LEVAALTGGEVPHPAAIAPHERLTVAIDGPSGSGKSTVGFALARRLGANFVDTGLMYRALTLAALERGVDVDDADALGRLAREARIQVRRPLPGEKDRRETVLLDDADVTHAARRPRVDRAVSAVSRHANVRDAMLQVQRAVAEEDDTVMVGRDIGTVVLPDATLKVFLVATPEVRAARRAAQMGRPDRLDRYLVEIRERDAADSGRAVAPLRQASGALVLDTGELSVDACVEAIMERLPASPATAAAGASVHA
jgi:cytidylate kinase